MRRKIILVAALMLIAVSGCLKPALPPQVTPQLDRRQTDAVKGKTIVIDPGHGGPEFGAVSSSGLKEAEVNLGVALYLWGFLKDAGANPVLTRSTDAGVCLQEPFTLKSDLEARSALSNACGADLFVSVHHNADALHSRRDDLIVFYAMSDQGQSRDLARDVCAALKEKLAPGKALIQPGNFHVLRNTAAPAILGEASFMTDKTTATKLAYHRTLAAEAAGYFQGICAYYAKGIPQITMLSPQDVTITETRPEIRCRVYPGTDNASLAAASITLQLDGKPVTAFRFQDQEITFVPPEPLANGSHQYCLAARNSNGNSSPRQCASFTVALPPRQVTVTPLLPVIPADGTAWTPLTIAVHDELQRPVADGTRVSLSATAGRLDNSTLATVGGRAQTLLRSDTTQGQVTVRAKAGAAAGSGDIRFGVPDDGLLLVRVQGPAGKPIQDAALLSNDRQIAVSDGAGFVHDRAVSTGQAAYRIYKKGYLASCISASLAPGTLTTQTVELTPVDGGVLFDRVIMLDPAGASAASRPVMSSLAARIENAGGTAVLSWTEPPAPSDTARALRAGQANADIFLRFEMTRKQLSVRYYYKSPQGEELAAQIARNLNSRAPVQKKKWVAAAGTDYVLAHTAMPAVIIALPEQALRVADEVAQSIYDALREHVKK